MNIAEELFNTFQFCDFPYIGICTKIIKDFTNTETNHKYKILKFGKYEVSLFLNEKGARIYGYSIKRNETQKLFDYHYNNDKLSTLYYKEFAPELDVFYHDEKELIYSNNIDEIIECIEFNMKFCIPENLRLQNRNYVHVILKKYTCDDQQFYIAEEVFEDMEMAKEQISQYGGNYILKENMVCDYSYEDDDDSNNDVYALQIKDDIKLSQNKDYLWRRYPGTSDVRVSFAKCNLIRKIKK